MSKVKNRQTNELIMIRIYGWFPANLCVTSSGDILVNMYDNDQTRSKAVPYLGSTDKQLDLMKKGKYCSQEMLTLNTSLRTEIRTSVYHTVERVLL